MAEGESGTHVNAYRHIEADQSFKQCLGCGNRNNLRCFFNENNCMSAYQNVAITNLFEEVLGVADIAKKRLKSVKICRTCKNLLGRSMLIKIRIQSNIKEIYERHMSNIKSRKEALKTETVGFERASIFTPTLKKETQNMQYTSTDDISLDTGKEFIPKTDICASGEVDFESITRQISDENVNTSHHNTDCYSAFTVNHDESKLFNKTHSDEQLLQLKHSPNDIAIDHDYNKSSEEVAIESQKSEHTYFKTDEQEQAFRINNRVNEKLKTYNEFSKVIDQTERAKLLLALNQKALTQRQFTDTVMECTNLFEIIKYKLIRDIDHMCERLCSKTTEPGPSVLRTCANDKEKLGEDKIIHSAITELDKCLPFVCDVFATVACSDGVLKQNTHRVIAKMYGMAMHNRNTQLCALRKLNTATCTRSTSRAPKQESSKRKIKLPSRKKGTGQRKEKKLKIDIDHTSRKKVAGQRKEKKIKRTSSDIDKIHVTVNELNV